MGPSDALKHNAAYVKTITSMRTQAFVACALLVLILNVPKGHASASALWRTLHFPTIQDAGNKVENGLKIVAGDIESTLEHGAKFWRETSRSKRATDDIVDPNNRTTVANLADAHTTLWVHWAGEGSDVIIALAKSPLQSNSALFLSKDYGKTFTDVSSQLRVDWFSKAVISNYYSARSFNNYYVFTDEENKCIFTTDNTGDNFRRHCFLPFSPRVVRLNSVNPRHILAMDDQSELKQLYLSENFGETWRAVYSRVKSFYWGIPPIDNSSTIFVVEELPSYSGQVTGKLQVVRSDTLFHSSYDTVVVMTDVVDFEVREDYMYAIKSVILLGSQNNPHLQLWVSYKRGEFVRAEFPGNHVFTDYYVADASEGQLMVCAYINNSYTNLYVSEVTGYKFSLSMERIVYFNPKTIRNQNWIRFYSNTTFADITKLHGVSGIYIASQQINDTLEVEEQRTLITYDKGGSWKPITAPEYMINNLPTNCKVDNGCSLHLTQDFHRLYPGSQISPILTQRSSPGLVIASGFLAKTLKGDPHVFVSANAGITWRHVLSGSYFFASADHGGIIVAAHQFDPIDEVVYSIDEGETWHSYRFIKEPIKVYGLLTEPGENSTVFSVFGSPLGPHSWQIIQIDFKNVFEGKKCGPSDYKMWSVSEDLPNNGSCLLGHVTMYQRRTAHAVCYNGDDFVRRFVASNCTCRREDFECDFGFEDHGSCQRDLSVSNADVYQIPSYCPPGTFYSYTRGYRKVAGDTCVGGEEHRYGPLQLSCPIRERSEFLLVTLENQVKMIDLSSAAQVLLLDEHVSNRPAIFDYEMNCLIYVDAVGDMKRKCFAAGNINSIITHEIIHRARWGARVTSMAFEWTGRNIYYTDSNDTISVVNVDGRFERTLYSVDNGVSSPQAIVVDPHHGYLFFVGENSKSQNFSIFRAAMDGSDNVVEVMIRDHVLKDTSLTIDIDTESLYWLTPTEGAGYKSDFHGQSANISFHVPASWPLPSAIGIYKNDLYVSSRAGSGILMANKNNPTSWHYFALSLDVYSMVVVSNTSQHAASACSAYHTPCSQLCLPHPSIDSHNRTCLCGDGYRRTTQPPSRDETCTCEDGEVMHDNGTCVTAPRSSSCSTEKFTCRNGNCVMLSWKCDGEDDCGDGSDEIDCPYSVCGKSSFTCRSGKCIPWPWVCDMQDDCKDGFQSDEFNCANMTCSNGQFKCANGYCINKNYVCDMDDDCHDHSDELNCNIHNSTSCSSWYFTCDSGTCIDRMYKCDGRNDCGDNSDERQCPNHNSSCTDYEFDCGQGMGCIFRFWQCDGEADCKNGADEKGCELSTTSMPRPTATPSACPYYMYKCRNNYCIGLENVCNGVNDCGDSSDETNCGSLSPNVTMTTIEPSHGCNRNQFFCQADHLCLPIWLKCDGEEDCSDGTDELNCATDCGMDPLSWFQCKLGQCIRESWVCDGDKDCPLGDDEVQCGNHTHGCTYNEFQCLSGFCISMSLHCDNSVDCDDGSDESGCHEPSAVNCSIFDNAKEGCCGNSECGVFIPVWDSFGGGTCMNMNSSVHYFEINECERFVPVAYECGAEQFKCGDASKSCVSFVQVCDRNKDCNNGRDEEACSACLEWGSKPSATYNAASTSITWRVDFNFTQLSYAEIIPNLGLANLTWRNLSSSNMMSANSSSPVVKDLKPYTAYYFAFLKQSPGISCVLKSYTATTADGIPSPPTNLTSKVRIENYPLTYSVDLHWSKPDSPNGVIKSYNIYYQIIDANGKALSGVSSKKQSIWQPILTVDYRDRIDQIQPNMTYSIWVTAETTAGESPPSQKSTIQVAAVSDVDLNVTVKNLTDSSFTLTWARAASAIGYQVTVRFQEFVQFAAASISKRVLHVNSSETSITVGDLCPGTTVFVGIRVVYQNDLLGPEFHPYNTTLEGGEIHMTGVTPVAVFSKPEQVEATEALLRYNLTVGGPSVKKNYIYYTYDTNIAPLNVSVVEVSHKLQGLYACQKYSVWIRPAFPTCPFTDIVEFNTKEDVTAPPMNVKASLLLVDHHYSLTLTWKPTCPDNLGMLEGYTIHVKWGDKEEQEGNSSTREYLMPYVLDGTNYTFTVKANYTGSKNSAPYTVFIPYIGKPSNLVLLFNGGNNITLRWQFPPAEDKANKFKHFVVRIKNEGNEVTKFTTISEISLLLWEKGLYWVTVTAEAESGHVIGESEHYEFPFENYISSPNTGAVSISKTNLVAIIVPVVLVVVALSAALVVFIVRHKRLQRSFLAFANSHYNIQSGTTTFSDDMALDGDEPLIQGFSDDEPLVIA